jgi:hypothetical protein
LLNLFRLSIWQKKGNIEESSICFNVFFISCLHSVKEFDFLFFSRHEPVRLADRLDKRQLSFTVSITNLVWFVGRFITFICSFWEVVPQSETSFISP